MQLSSFTPYIPTVLYSFCLQALLLLLPLSIVEAGQSASLAAMIVAARGIGLLLTNIPSGYINDHFGSAAGMLTGAVFFVLGYALVALFSNPQLMVAGGIVIGIGLSLGQIGRQGFVAFHLNHASVGVKLSFLGTAVRLGSLVGPLFAAVMADNFGYPVSFRTLLLLAFASLLIEASIVLRSSVPKPDKGVKRTMTLREMLEFLGTRKRIFFTTSGYIFTLQCVRSGKLVLIALIGLSLDFSVSSIGVAAALGTLVDSVVSTRAGWLMDRYGRRWSALPSLLGLSLGLLFLGLAQSYLFFLFAVLFLGLSNGISSGLVLVLAADLASSEKGTSQFLALIKLISDCGLAFYPLVIGIMLLKLPLAGVTTVTMVLGLAVTVFMYFRLRETKDLKR